MEKVEGNVGKNWGVYKIRGGKQGYNLRQYMSQILKNQMEKGNGECWE